MSFPYTEEMMESVKKVEATRAARMAAEPRRMTAEEKDALLEQYHPDYNLSSFAEIIVGPNKGEKAPKELVELLQAKSRVQGMTLDLAHPDYDVDVLVIGGGGSGASAAWIPPSAIMVLASPIRSLVTIITLAPALCASMAQEEPAPPPPITSTSTS